MLPHLNNRTDGSVEFKHQNISAVLIKMGRPYIRGYKPKSNYQKVLEDHVIKVLQSYNDRFEPLFESFASEAASPNPLYRTDFNTCVENGPIFSKPHSKESSFQPFKVNYLEKEQNNRTIGLEGERFVMEYERWRLETCGRKDLIGKIEWTSREKGDGAGYDILSKNVDESNRYIEVKTTKLSKETPIFLSDVEILFAAKHSSNFCLYRVFDFHSQKKMFIRHGCYNDFCNLLPIAFKGFFVEI